MSAKVSLMDPEFGYCRVIGATSESEALAAAQASWLQGKPPDYWMLNQYPKFVVESSGWYRCQPCVCGLGHPYDLWPTEPHARGASFTYLIELEVAKDGAA